MTAEGKRNTVSLKHGLILLAIISVLALVLYLQFADSLSELWPSQSAMESEIFNLKKRQKRLQALLNENYKFEQDRLSFIRYARGFWIETRDGSLNTSPQAKIRTAARAAGLNLSSVGRVTSSKICEGVFANDISISAKGGMKEIGGFIVNIYGTRPVMYWHRLSIRPNNPRAPKYVLLSGQLRFISITDEDLIKMVLN